MIIIKLITSNEMIELNVNGHALFADEGEDVVCAGISSIIFGALNAFDQMINDINFEISDHIEVITKRNEKVDSLFKFLMIQLKTVEESYPTHISIYEESR